MANYEIDQLSIDIKVIEKDVAKRINEITDAISNLTNAVKSFDKVSKSLSNTKKVQSVSDNLKGVLKKRNESISTVKNTQEMAGAKYFDDDKTLDRLKNANKLAKELDRKKMENAHSWLTKIQASIVRVAFYRLVRAAIKEITDAFREGLNAYVQYDEATNQAMSSIKNAGDQVKNTLGVTAGILMQSLAPAITLIADTTTNFLNDLNMVLAKLGGSDTYTKAIKQNEDYAESLKKANNQLLEFDTFTTLATNKDSSTEGMFEEVKIEEEMTGAAGIFEAVTTAVKGLIDALTFLYNGIKPILEFVMNVFGSVVDVVSGMVTGVGGLLKLLTGDFKGAWDAINEGANLMAEGLLNTIINVLNLIIDAVNYLVIKLNPITWIADLFGVNTSNWGIPHIPLASFANGGSFNTADMFYANENGNTELIASNNAGGGAVMNMQQLQTAIYNGMIMAMNQGGNESAIYFDGNRVGTFVAGNAGFRNEANRRNVSLNWK